MKEQIKNKLALLPDQPGCYLMKDKNGTIIYVGKAKILKNRVRSYFTGSHDTKTERLVQEIADFEYVVTESNTEALLLEINLIQKNKPKYNIMLKDDKSYPFIKVTNERYPKLIITRKVLKDGALYFGIPVPIPPDTLQSRCSGCNDVPGVLSGCKKFFRSHVAVVRLFNGERRRFDENGNMPAILVLFTQFFRGPLCVLTDSLTE